MIDGILSNWDGRLVLYSSIVLSTTLLCTGIVPVLYCDDGGGDGPVSVQPGPLSVLQSMIPTDDR